MSKIEIPQSMLYPTFQIVQHAGGVVPNIMLPPHYQELVPQFYQQKRKEKINSLVETLEQMLKENNHEIDIRLNWDDTEGLHNISIGIHGGLDLNTRPSPRFTPHNLGWYNSLYAAIIGQNYVAELLKSGETT